MQLNVIRWGNVQYRLMFRTGIQAVERLEKDLPMRPGKVERKEFEYVRHGTQTLIANFDVATGKVIEPNCGDSRTFGRFSH